LPLAQFEFDVQNDSPPHVSPIDVFVPKQAFTVQAPLPESGEPDGAV
jgi:hypothetical protein